MYTATTQSQYRRDSYEVYNSQFHNNGEVFENKAESLYERSDQIASKILADDEKKKSEWQGGFLGRIGRIIHVGDVNVGSNNWGPTSIGGSVGSSHRKSNKDYSGLVLLAGSATLGLLTYTGYLYKQFETSRKEKNEFQEEFQYWYTDELLKKYRPLPYNEDVGAIARIFDHTKMLLNEKYGRDCWNLALAVSIATSTFFLTVGAIIAAEGLMVVSGLAILTSASICVIRIGYRWGDTSEVDSANKITGDCKILREIEFPMLLQDNVWVRLNKLGQVKEDDDYSEQQNPQGQYRQPHFDPQPQDQRFAYPGYSNQPYAHRSN